jgi:molybdopterin/thiamine biosynthesis adenylyltransferase
MIMPVAAPVLDASGARNASFIERGDLPPAPAEGWNYDEAFRRNLGLIGEDEQRRLRESRVAIVGMGGVGGVHLATLCRLGIGRFHISDFDTFSVANFNRQYGARVDTVGRPKVHVMAEEARKINPEIELRMFDQGIDESTIDQFLDGVDLLVDGIDYFAIDMRRRLYRRAAERGIPAIMAGPMGFGTAWLVFDSNGMSFDRYFDLSDGQPEVEQLICFTVGLAPAGLHLPYLDLSRVNLAEKYGPSSGLACALCAGVTGAEAIKLLLKRGRITAAPFFSQFDPYRGLLRRRQMRGGNRNWQQRAKRWYLRRKVSRMGLLPSTV